ncbi:MAG: alpha/beta fold hydrolase BchO [Betaproteobacteria bacterium]|jgi:magnesium chelatase accessory protein
MSEALSWDRDGADWPLREHSRFVSQGHLRWHVQRLLPPPSATAAARPQRLWLLHGTGASTHTWRDAAPILAQHHEVISVDLPGHAFTRGAVDDDLTLPGMARALIALQAALSAEEQPGPASSATAGGAPARADIWIGHSAGAAVALQVMLLQPSVVREVISLNGALLPWGGRAASLFMPVARALATNPGTTRFFVWNARRPGTVDLLLRDTGSVIDERGHRLYERLAHNELHLRAVLRMMAQWELEPFARELPRLQGRVTLISSAQDGTVPPSISARAAALIPGSKLIALPRWGHLGHEEAPAEWASLVLQALAP